MVLIFIPLDYKKITNANTIAIWCEWRKITPIFFLYFCLHYYNCLHFFPFAHLHKDPTTPHPLLRPSTPCCPCSWVMPVCPLANPFTFFHPAPSSVLTAISLFSLTMPPFQFCSLVYFFHDILHISEIIWYLSFTDWLISLNIILFRSIHAVTMGKSSFLFTAVCYFVV